MTTDNKLIAISVVMLSKSIQSGHSCMNDKGWGLGAEETRKWCLSLSGVGSKGGVRIHEGGHAFPSPVHGFVFMDSCFRALWSISQ